MSANVNSEVNEPVLLREDDNGVCTLTLNRPRQYNALSTELLTQLQNAIATISEDDKIRVVIIAANGKAFCPGHDLKEMRSSEEKSFLL